MLTCLYQHDAKIAVSTKAHVGTWHSAHIFILVTALQRLLVEFKCEVVVRDRDSQLTLQVGEYCSHLFNFRPNIFKII